jgi:hypothetical protein
MSSRHTKRAMPTRQTASRWRSRPPRDARCSPATVGDFTAIFEDSWYAGRDHSGVIVSEQLELGEMIRRVARLLDTVDADDMRNNWKNLAEFAALSPAGMSR